MLKICSALLAAAVVITAAVRLSAHDPIGTKVTWDREIAPIIAARCVSCHTDGGKAPMSLTTYEQARPWARAIREEVLTRRMPRWHVVRGYGDVLDDPSLSPFEIALIVSWVDGGAPKRRPPAPGSRPTPPPPSPLGRQAFTPPATSEVTLPCREGRLPAGRLVGVRPTLEEGTDLRITIATPDGGEDPLLWVRGYEREYGQVYWLRTPRAVRSGTRLTLDGTGECRVTFLFEAQTAQ